MDVISLGKAMKAKKAMRALDKRLGEGVEDVHENVKTRLEELEKHDPGTILSKRASALEKNTAINLNKTNLKINGLLSKSKYQHKDMIVDDLENDEGIDSGSSVNLTYDATSKLVKQNDLSTNAVFVGATDILDEVPVQFALSVAANASSTGKESVDFSSTAHISLQTEWDNATKILKVKKVSSDADAEYYEKATWESGAIDLGDNCKGIKKLHFTHAIPNDGGTPPTDKGKIEYYTATSTDGVTFSPFVLTSNLGDTYSSEGRYVKIQIKIETAPTLHTKKMTNDTHDDNIIENLDTYSLKTSGLLKRFRGALSLDSVVSNTQQLFGGSYGMSHTGSYTIK